MYHVHENVVVVGIDLSGFSMYYLFKKIRFVVVIENVEVVVCKTRNRQQAGGTLPPCLHCQTATGKQPPRVVSPPRYRREWRIKKIPGGGFLALGMIPSAVKVGLNLVDPSDIRRPWMMMGRASAAALAVFG